jgi:hypothetical protein
MKVASKSGLRRQKSWSLKGRFTRGIFRITNVHFERVKK